jgi:7 transmembrane receptor (Secretin family).
MLTLCFSLCQYIPDPSVSEDIVTYGAFCLALPMLLAALLILVLIRGVETNSNSIHKNVVACVLLAELLFFVALKTRKTLVQHEVSADCEVLCACGCVTGAGGLAPRHLYSVQ